MEQHPVPQNVTTFQFRLIGDMTLKQFGYLIAGAILAFIAYKLPLPFVITWPLTGAFAFLGVGFAFIPIEERPMDVWVFSFFKSIYSPTQYIWSHDTHSEQEPVRPPVAPTPTQKNPIQTTTPAASSAAAQTKTPVSQPATTQPVIAPQPNPQQPVASTQKAVLSGLFSQQSNQPKPNVVTVAPQPRQSLIDELLSFFQPRPAHKTQTPPQSMNVPPLPSVTGHRPEPTITQPPLVDTTTTNLMHEKMMRLEETLKSLEGRLASKAITEDRVIELQKQLTDVLNQKNKTEDELVMLKRQLDGHTPPHITPTPVPTTTQPETPKPPTQVHGVVNVITTQEGAMKAGLPRLTNTPNVITGLVKDDAGNFLPGILVTVTNHEGIPVRALKTNKLGQFAASTPLSTGVYFVEIEDPRSRFTFSRVQITLNGAVVPVLEIIAKSEKALTRERLAQEIFGRQSA